MVDDINFEKYKEYKDYVENIRKEMVKLCGIPRDLYEKRKN